MDVRMPDGTVITNVPEGTRQQDLIARYQKASVAANPADVPPSENFWAGMGKAFHDLSMGYLQRSTGLIPPELMDEVKRRDAPLMKTGAGTMGNIAGNVAMTLPAAFIPGVNTVPGAAAIGALASYLEPTGAHESAGINAVRGAAVGAAIPGGAALLRGGKALLEPLTQGGRDAVVGRTADRFLGNDPAALWNLQNPASFVKGSNPTSAEATGNAGLAMLENAAQTRDPIIKQAFAQRQQANQGARFASLSGVAGDDAAIEAAKAARAASSSPLYEAAKNATAQGDSALNALLSRPSMKDAWGRAQRLAQENGETLTLGVDAPASQATTGILDAAGNAITREVPAQSMQYSGRGLHYLKMALDDMSNPAVATSIGKNEQRALAGTRDQLLTWMDAKLPGYGQAREAYASGSQPINQMQVGQALLDKYSPALNDFGGTTRQNAATFAQAVREGDRTAAQATGFKGAKMADILTPEQMKAVTGVAKDLSRRAGTEDMMRGVGSNTAQNLAAQNFLGQMFGPLGLPQSVGDRLLSNVMATPYVGGVLQFGLKSPEQAIQNRLGEGLLTPQLLAQLIEKSRKTSTGLLGNRIPPYLPGANIGLLGLSNLGQQ